MFKGILEERSIVRSFRLLTVAALAVMLVLPFVQNVFAGTWLLYDNNPVSPSPSWESPGKYVAVLFSLPPGWSGATVLTIRYYIVGTTPTIVYRYLIHIIDGDGTTSLFTIELRLGSLPVGWSDLALPSHVAVSGEFYVAVEYTTDPGPTIGLDTSGTPSYHDRSYHGTPGHWVIYGQGAFPRGDLMIRAEVDPLPPVPEYPLGLVLLVAPLVAIYVLVRRTRAE